MWTCFTAALRVEGLVEGAGLAEGNEAINKLPQFGSEVTHLGPHGVHIHQGLRVDIQHR